MEPKRVLVTGATGYVGGRLVACLTDAGFSVRCMARDLDRMRGFDWFEDVDPVQGDVLEAETLVDALKGIDIAYYLIHSLAGGLDYADRDRQGAINFARAAEEAGVLRIIYLGGLEPTGSRRSEHLASRLKTGDALRSTSVPVTEFRAAVIVGSGSFSFEIVRYLTERVPIMICPKWVRTPTQPIAIRNVLQYLVEAARRKETAGTIYEIGGADVVTYRDMFQTYARVRGLRRPVIDVPVLTPRLSSRWVGFFTPLNYKIARPLIEGLDNEVVVRDDSALRDFSVTPLSYEEAVRLAIQRFERDEQATSWHGAYSSSRHRGTFDSIVEDAHGMIQERRRGEVARPPKEVYDVVQRLGGAAGWLYMDYLWSLRGAMDSLIGGVGLRRGRRSPNSVRVGDAVDWWRVEVADPGKRLRLRAEMKIPGRAWLQFDIEPIGDDESRSLLTQTAFFEPRGLLGLAYWYALYPVHKVMFRGMVHALRDQIESGAAAGVKGTSSKKHVRRPV